MDNEWEDYYQILQVHFMAEQEIIKGAYLRLSKKYHPDNNGAFHEEKMKSINKAYAILSNPDTRNEYTMRWVEKLNEHNSNINNNLSIEYVNISIEPARKVLLNYLTAISKGEYEFAYELLTEKDKKKISVKEFIRWQTLVGEIFTLLSFTLALHSVDKDINVKHNYFETCIKMTVKVVEENHLMDRIEEDTLYKNIVYENETWCVYLGYTNLKGIINKFNSLVRLNKQKTVSEYNKKPLVQNKKDFIEIAQREQMRYNRYGNIFSMIVCRICNPTIEVVEQDINDLLRKLDCTCRWNNNTQLILLPETEEKAAWLVANKIKKSLEENFDNKNGVSITFKVMQQQYNTLDDLMEKILD